MDDMEIFRKLAQCEDKEQMQRCIDEYNKSQKPMTNADRIRSMSDEELALWMAECNAYKENADASQWLPWLKQPAEEGADNGNQT